MRVVHLLGVRLEGDEMIEIEDYEYVCKENIGKFVIAEDCYSGEFQYFGVLLNLSQDYRHEDQDFYWTINDGLAEEHLTVFENIEKLNIKNKQIQQHVFTYYT